MRYPGGPRLRKRIPVDIYESECKNFEAFLRDANKLGLSYTEVSERFAKLGTFPCASSVATPKQLVVRYKDQRFTKYVPLHLHSYVRKEFKTFLYKTKFADLSYEDLHSAFNRICTNQLPLKRDIQVPIMLLFKRLSIS